VNHLTIGLLLVAVGAMVGAASFLVRRSRPGVAQVDPGPAAAVLSYVAAAFGVLIGFVIVFLLGQAANARQATGDEATSIGTAFDEAQLFPAAERDLQHALICYARSVSELEWPTLAIGMSSPATDEAYRELIGTYGAVEEPADGTFQPAAATNSFVQIGGISTARETRLVAAQFGVGPLLWVLLVGGAVLVLSLLFVASVAASPLGQAVLLGVAGMFTAVLLAMVVILGSPFREGTGPLTPRLIEENTERMVAIAPDAAAEPCSFEQGG
jgi:hypothetical protein